MGVSRIRHVKIPVTDVSGSARWYQALLGLELAAEFVEQGVLRGVALRDPDGGYLIALRDRGACAGQPRLDGFDVVALDVEAREDLDRLTARWDEQGIAHTGVRDLGPNGASVDASDPDGTVIRFLHDTVIGRDGFVGVHTDAAGRFEAYDQPRFLG